MNDCSTPVNPKRKKCEASPDTSSISDTIDVKKAKQILSISESGSDLDISVDNMAEEEKHADQQPQTKMTVNVDKLFEDLDQKLQERMTLMKKGIVDEIKETLAPAINILEGKVLKIEIDNQALNKQVTILKSNEKKHLEKEKELEEKISNLEDRIIRNEQYSRRSNVRISGLFEREGEDTVQLVTGFFKEKMKIEVNTTPENLIEAAHRLDVKSAAAKVNGARPVLVRFRSVATKIEVMKARRQLKGQPLYINEDLCREIQTLFNRVRKHSKIDQAWTWNGTVYGKDDTDHVYKVPYGKPLSEILKK